MSCQTLSSEAAILGGASGQSRGRGCDSRRSLCLVRYGAFELENQSVPPDGPAVMSVGERYGVGANLIHPIPVLSAIDRVIHSGWPNRKRGGTGRVGHDCDAPAVSSRTVATFFPRPTAVVGIGRIGFHHLRMIVVAADNRQAIGVQYGDRENALVQACDQRRLGGRPSLAGKTWTASEAPLVTGLNQGVFSIAVLDANRLAIVGGDYDHPQVVKPNSAYSDDGGRTWKESSHRPAGYRWCVAIVPDTPGPTAFAVGPTGMDYSIDGGKNWDRMNEVSANTIAFADAHHGWAIGRNGLILKFEGAVPH